MAWHLFVTGPWQLSERPDQLLEQAFALFDKYPDFPYLVLLSNDDMDMRDRSSAPGAPWKVKDGYYIPERPDATAVFVLARRARSCWKRAGTKRCEPSQTPSVRKARPGLSPPLVTMNRHSSSRHSRAA
jgi:hypothetical protein